MGPGFAGGAIDGGWRTFGCCVFAAVLVVGLFAGAGLAWAVLR